MVFNYSNEIPYVEITNGNDKYNIGIDFSREHNYLDTFLFENLLVENSKLNLERDIIDVYNNGQQLSIKGITIDSFIIDDIKWNSKNLDQINQYTDKKLHGVFGSSFLKKNVALNFKKREY